MPQIHKLVHYVEEGVGVVVTGLHKDMVPHAPVPVPIHVHMAVIWVEQHVIKQAVILPHKNVHVHIPVHLAVLFLEQHV